ncbi:DUF4013 domain-containing protein [Haloarcula nitratireducens]|uniref:DUF4013 domain-containing protein n=1 Tax=Haloarcula nitratireducens TaxID=2487749 RepID=A0AAW4P8F8_9EURY|nr:DUF4013 domain-containing protein [Halomicroarcula nitratireducens]MBX0294336.1 DUF4013 domain-containing protein [Halomicroarcula nitratireducens]
MLEDALRFPWNGEKKGETLLVGGLLSLLGFLFVPLLFVYGYLVRVIRQVAAGEPERPPVFDDWGELLVDGVVAFVISLVYLLVPTVAIAFVGGLFLFPVIVVEGSAAGAVGPRSGLLAVGGLLLALLALSASFLLLLAAAYLAPAGVAAFARTGRFGAAFSPSHLRTVGGDRRYATGWLVAVVVGFLAQVVAGAVGATGLGALLVPFVLFYGSVASAYAIGVGVSELGLTAETDEESTASQPAV